MASRVAVAWSLLQFLILLSLIESLLSFIFSLLSGKTVEFPFVLWLELLAYTFIIFFLNGLHLFGTFIGAIFGIISLATVFDAIIELGINALVLPVVFIYPLLAVADAVTLAIFDIPFFAYLLFDGFFIGGIADPIAPQAPNIFHFIYNLDKIPTVITYVLSAIGAATVAEAWIFYGTSSRSSRLLIWERYRALRDGDTPSTPPPTTTGIFGDRHSSYNAGDRTGVTQEK